MDTPVPTPRCGRYSRICGTGSYLPPHRVSNEALTQRLAAKGIATSDEWIVSRTGIHARHFASADVSASDLAVPAAQAALAAAGCTPQDLDMIIVATSTPDMVFPSTACWLQHKLGAAGCAAFDVQAVCCGFIYGLSVADAMIRAEQANTVLVVGSEVFSKLLNFDDRNSCVLFGDGAGAVVLSPSDRPGILACELHADGAQAGILSTPAHLDGGRIVGSPFLQMDGPAVFKQAVTALESVAWSVLKRAQLQPQDVDWLVPHQANIRIIAHTAHKLGLSMDKVISTVGEHANTSAASIPLALDYAVRAGRVQAEQVMLLEGVGGGFTWGAVALRW